MQMSMQLIKSKYRTFTKSIDNSGSSTVPEGTGSDELDKVIAIAGYSYDEKQDIFYSTLDPWQRKIGYCRLYDEMAAPLGMIIDCEPILFNYLGKEWLIGFWKGQYDYVTGGEIGIYTRTADRDILSFFNGAYYDCVSNNDLLNMSYTLKKNGITLFTREGKHWWLTGFKLGEFSNPAELTMEISITLHNLTMRNAFLTGLWNAGYNFDEFTRDGNTVIFTFDKPHSPPPRTRTPATDRIIQKKNKFLCEKYLEITKSSNTIQDKLKAIEEKSPFMYGKVLRTGKSHQLYETFASWITRSIAK